MKADVLIPTHNHGPFIAQSVHAALQVADDLDGRVIVSMNDCTDETGDVLASIASPRLVVVRTERYVHAFENWANCTRYSDADYIIFCSSDDVLHPGAQKAIWNVAIKGSSYPSVFFGDYDRIDVCGRPLDHVSMRWRWSSASRKTAIVNVAHGRFPNINGAWIPRNLWLEFERGLGEELVKSMDMSRCGDVYWWLFASSRVSLLYRPVTQSSWRLHTHVCSSKFKDDTYHETIAWSLVRMLEWAHKRTNSLELALRAAYAKALRRYGTSVLIGVITHLSSPEKEQAIRKLMSNGLTIGGRLVAMSSLRSGPQYRLLAKVLFFSRAADGWLRNIIKRVVGYGLALTARRLSGSSGLGVGKDRVLRID